MNSTPLAVKATVPQLTRSMRVGEAYRVIANNCLDHIDGNRDGVAARDGEAVHQMRVALRRWKSAGRLFRAVAVLPPELQAEVDWLAGQLGPARDWDVLASTTLPAIARRAADPVTRGAMTALGEAADEAARLRRQAAAQAVAAPRYTTLIDDLGAWANALEAGEQPVAEFASTAMRRDRKRLARRARRLAHADAGQRHRVRIAAKKCRYDTEFFLSLHDSKSWRRYLRRLVAIQDALGALNDASVARGLLAEIAVAPVLAEAAGFVHGYLSAGQAEAIGQVKRRWRRLAPMRVRV